MSEESVEAARQGFDALAREGLTAWTDGAERFIPEGIEWDWTAYPLPDFATSGVGRKGFIELLRNYAAAWDEVHQEATELIDAGDSVVAVIHERSRSSRQDLDLERDFAAVLGFRQGLLASYTMYPDRGSALEAAGIDPP